MSVKNLKNIFNKAKKNSLHWHVLGGNNKYNIGANSGLCVYKYFDEKGKEQQKALLFDIGIMGGDRRKPEDPILKDSDIIIPDYDKYLYKHDDDKHQPEMPIDSIFLTHNHSDHMGALPLLTLMGYKLPKIYATPYTARRLEQAFSNAGIEPNEWPKVYSIAPGKPVNEGPVSVTSFWVSHSTPQSVGFFIETPEGNMLNPGDFKLDKSVVWGPAFNEDQFKRIVSKPVDALLLDSTGAGKDDIQPVTESDLRETLDDLMNQYPDKRFIVAVMRGYEESLASVAAVTAEQGRKLWLAGGSHEQIVYALRETGMSFSDHLNVKLNSQILNSSRAAQELAKDKPGRSVVVVTGAQGHTGAALTRAVDDNHNHLKLNPKKDIVLFCAPLIPGQEQYRGRVLSKLRARGFTVLTKDERKLYPHSHARVSEVKDFIKLSDPKTIIHIHGTKKLRKGCGDLAQKMGKKVVQADNGDILKISKGGRVRSIEPETKDAPHLVGFKTLQGSSWTDRYYLMVKTVNNQGGKKAVNGNDKKPPRPKIFSVDGK